MKAKSLREAIESLHTCALGFHKDTEILPLLSAQNRILAKDIFATKALPSFDNAGRL